MKRNINLESVRRFAIKCLSTSMLTMIWIVGMDWLLYRQAKGLIVCLSVLALSLVIHIFQPIYKHVGEKHPILELLLQYILVLMLFIVFKKAFNWYEESDVKLIIIYTLPVFIACYGLGLVGVNRDAKCINKMLKERQSRS